MITLLVLTAPWCGTCHAAVDTAKKVAARENVECSVVDIEKQPSFGEGVTQVPEFRAMLGDSIVSRISGLATVQALQHLVASAKESS